jgi:hypothetical protein
MTRMSTLYPHTCKIQVRSKLGDGQLGPCDGWADEQLDVPCKFEMMSADMVTRIYGEGVLRGARLYLPPTVTVTENTRQVITTQAGFAGTWIVKGVFPYTTLPHYEVNLIPDMSTAAGQ